MYGFSRVDDGVFHRLPEEVLRVVHQVLVDGVVVRDQDGEGLLAAAARAAGLLPGRGDRAGEPQQDRGVERADVDAQFQGVRGGDAQQLPREEGLLDGPAFLGQVPAAIGPDAVGQRPLRSDFTSSSRA